jgi:hypothetical protein
MAHSHTLSFGAFEPAGHGVIAFPSASQAHAAAQALAALGLWGDAVHHWSDRDMLAQIEREARAAGSAAGAGSAPGPMQAHRPQAERGCHWLIVKASDTVSAAQVAACVKPFGGQWAEPAGGSVPNPEDESADPVGDGQSDAAFAAKLPP